MAIITDETSFFGFTTGLGWLGKYGASTGTQDMSSSLNVANSYVSTAILVYQQAQSKLTHGFNTYFKMQGFNTSTSKYEVWFSTGQPLLVPPSGHTLSNIEIVLTWIDR